MNKLDIIREVALRIGLPELVVTANVEATLDVIQEALERKEEVRLQGVGKIVFAKTKAKIARNPQTNEEIYLPEIKRIKFIPTLKLKEMNKAKPISKEEYLEVKSKETY